MGSEMCIRDSILSVVNDKILGEVRVPRSPVQYSEELSPITTLAPFQGANNRELMLELGYKDSEFDQYVQDQILHQPIPGN